MTYREELIKEAVALFKSSEELLKAAKNITFNTNEGLFKLLNVQVELTRALVLLALAEAQK